MTVRVFHCDDSDGFRLLVAEVLAEESGIELVGQAADTASAVAGVARTRPDVLLLDLRGGDLGPHVVSAAREVAPGTAIVVLSGWEGPIDPGAVAARLEKGVAAAELVRTIRTVATARRMIDGVPSGDP